MNNIKIIQRLRHLNQKKKRKESAHPNLMNDDVPYSFDLNYTKFQNFIQNLA